MLSFIRAFSVWTFTESVYVVSVCVSIEAKVFRGSDSVYVSIDFVTTIGFRGAKEDRRMLYL